MPVRDPFHLFITHVTRHRRVAAQLQEAFAAYHIRSFVAHSDIQPTEEWLPKVEQALRRAEALVALVHRGFQDSDWTSQEVGIALGRNVPVVAIQFGQMPHGFLARVQAVNGQGRSVYSLSQEVFLLLARHEQTRERMAEALIQGFEASEGFSEAKENMALLEEMDHWDPGMPDRLRQAVRDNAFLADAWGVPERVEELLRRRNGGYAAREAR